MKHFRLLFILLLALSCQRNVPKEQCKDTVVAVLESGEESKVFIDSDLQIHWNQGDRISVFKGTTENREYLFTGADGDLSGTFESVESAGIAEADEMWAVYPYKSSTALADGLLTLELPSEQSYLASGFAPGASPMAAWSNNNQLYFRNLCGILALRIYGPTSVSKVTLKGNSGEILAGKMQVRCGEGAPEIQMLKDGALTELTLNCPSPVELGADSGNAVEFWFIVPPGAFEKGFSAEIYDESGRSYQASSAKRIEIGRARISRMAPVRAEPGNPTSAVIGKPLPAWKQGYLDIHGINGGRGEAFYYIMPDGTTMLVDAAGAPPAELYNYGEDDSQGVPSKPDVSIGSGTVIVEYIKHFAPVISGGRLNYFMTSHYHGDHIGAWRSNYKDFGWTPFDKNGNAVSSVNFNNGGFIFNGLPAVGMSIPIDKVLDRGDWSNRPSEDYYSSSGQKRYNNYVNFLDYSARKYGTVRETLKIGHTDQIVMAYQPDNYSNFSIRTIAAGGDIWTGSGTGVNTSYVPSAAECDANHEAWAINENIFSCVFHLSYGKFDWFSGGDIQYTGRSTYSWKDIELPISKVMKKVEAMKASHHSTKNTNSAELLGVLKPDVYIAGVWRDVQPNPATLKRVLNANSSVKIFTTNLAESNKTTLTNEGVNISKFSATQGHVVIRVLPGGGSFYVYVLDDSDLEYKVKSVFGPYVCK